MCDKSEYDTNDKSCGPRIRRVKYGNRVLCSISPRLSRWKWSDRFRVRKTQKCRYDNYYYRDDNNIICVCFVRFRTVGLKTGRDSVPFFFPLAANLLRNRKNFHPPKSKRYNEIGRDFSESTQLDLCRRARHVMLHGSAVIVFGFFKRFW